MANKKIKKVIVSESKLVDLIDTISKAMIEEKIAKGELQRVVKPKKTKKVTVTESQLAELIKTGRVLNVKKK